MPLPVLIALVVIGIAGIILAIRFSGLSKRLVLMDANDAEAAWTREFPAHPVTGITLCQRGTAALIETGSGPGIVWAVGADSTARFLAGATVQETPSHLILRLPDFTAPVIRVSLDETERKAWTQRIVPS